MWTCPHCGERNEFDSTCIQCGKHQPGSLSAAWDALSEEASAALEHMQEVSARLEVERQQREEELARERTVMAEERLAEAREALQSAKANEGSNTPAEIVGLIGHTWHLAHLERVPVLSSSKKRIRDATNTALHAVLQGAVKQLGADGFAIAEWCRLEHDRLLLLWRFTARAGKDPDGEKAAGNPDENELSRLQSATIARRDEAQHCAESIKAALPEMRDVKEFVKNWKRVNETASSDAGDARLYYAYGRQQDEKTVPALLAKARKKRDEAQAHTHALASLGAKPMLFGRDAWTAKHETSAARQRVSATSSVSCYVALERLLPVLNSVIGSCESTLGIYNALREFDSDRARGARLPELRNRYLDLIPDVEEQLEACRVTMCALGLAEFGDTIPDIPEDTGTPSGSDDDDEEDEAEDEDDYDDEEDEDEVDEDDDQERER